MPVSTLNVSAISTDYGANGQTLSSGKAFSGNVSDLAFWDLFQQIRQSSSSQTVLQGQVTASANEALATSEPSANTPLGNAANAAALQKADENLAHAAQTTQAHGKHTDAPLELKGPLTKDDERFLEWMLNQANQPPVVLPNGLPIPAWVANSTFSQDKQAAYSGLASQLSEDMVALVKQAYKTGRAIRVPLQNQTELILKIYQDRVSAEFIGSQSAMASTLQQTVADLKRHLASKQNLPIGDIGYRHEEQPQRQPSSSSDAEDEQ